jgi:hypothetical protein
MGRTQTAAQWARETGIDYETIRARILVYKWSVEDTLTVPTNGKPRPLGLPNGNTGKMCCPKCGGPYSKTKAGTRICKPCKNAWERNRRTRGTTRTRSRT